MPGALPRNSGNKSPNRAGTTVSRRLRHAGWNISPSARRYRYSGIFVAGRGDHVSVLVDSGVDARNATVAEEIRAVVRTWPQAGDVTITAADSGAAFVRFTYGRTSA